MTKTIDVFFVNAIQLQFTTIATNRDVFWFVRDDRTIRIRTKTGTEKRRRVVVAEKKNNKKWDSTFGVEANQLEQSGRGGVKEASCSCVASFATHVRFGSQHPVARASDTDTTVS